MIEVRKHLRRIERNIEGEVVRKVYYYTIDKRFLWFFWRHLRFNYRGTISKLMIPYGWRSGKNPSSIPNEDRVIFTFEILPLATRFDCEADAIRVKHDILQNPDKYILYT